METTAAKQAREKSANPAVVKPAEQRMPPAPLVAHEAPTAPARISVADKKAIGYGLPCSRCHAYYPSDMHACPICKSPDRVSPSAPVMHTTAPTPAAAAQTTEAQIQIDDERERFLKELKSQAFASHTQINAAATFRCVLEHQHSGATEPAAVCHTCYGDVRQQADRMEAALHMDSKEAAKIVYEAVWADTSDSNKTYLNAATALLTELRKRAGIGLLLGSHQPLSH
jgi:RNA polymerase subunit RPABC4/transcription elongation factor Spt4